MHIPIYTDTEWHTSNSLVMYFRVTQLSSSGTRFICLHPFLVTCISRLLVSVKSSLSLSPHILSLPSLSFLLQWTSSDAIGFIRGLICDLAILERNQAPLTIGQRRQTEREREREREREKWHDTLIVNGPKSLFT